MEGTECVGVIYVNKHPIFCPYGNGKFTEKDLSLILKKMKLVSPNGMKRLRRFKLEEVLKHIGKSRWKVWANSKLIWVPMKNQRMLLLGRSQECACCGLNATHFWLEHSGCKPPHLNMYGMNGQKEVMLTCDHIHPKSKGGQTKADNTQLLCSVCNSLKANHCMTLDELKEKRNKSNKN